MTAAPSEFESAYLAAGGSCAAVGAGSGALAHSGVVMVSVSAAGAAAAWFVSDVAAAVPLASVGVLAVAAAVSDIRTGRIPNRLILIALAVLAGSWVLVSVVDDRPLIPLLTDLAAGLALSGAPAMFVIWLVAPRVLGGGDWKLLSVLGIAIGYVAPLGATVIVMGAFVGGIAVATVARRRNIILGPPLALGYAAAVAAVVVAPDLFDNWYR